MQNNIHSRLEKLEAIHKVDKHDPWAGLTDAEIVEMLIGTLQKVDGCSYEEASADPAVAAALAGYRAEREKRGEAADRGSI